MGILEAVSELCRFRKTDDSLCLDVGCQLADALLPPLLIIEQRPAALMVVIGDFSGGRQRVKAKSGLMQAYSISVFLGSAMAGRPRWKSRVSVVLEQVGAELR